MEKLTKLYLGGQRHHPESIFLLNPASVVVISDGSPALVMYIGCSPDGSVTAELTRAFCRVLTHQTKLCKPSSQGIPTR